MVRSLTPNSFKSCAARGGWSYPSWPSSKVLTEPFFRSRSKTARGRLPRLLRRVSSFFWISGFIVPHCSEQLRWSDSEAGRQPHDVDKRNVSFATLNASDVCSVEVRPKGQLFLVQPLAMAQVADDGSEIPQKLRFRLRIRRLLTICLRGDFKYQNAGLDSTDLKYHFPKPMTKEHKLTVLDLYSGLGGLSLGFEYTGSFRTVAGLDFYPPAVKTFYSYHECKSPILTAPQDLTELEPQRVLDELGQKPDLIVGGPPCQGFSHAGRRLENLEHDPRNAQVFRYRDYVKAIRPKAFLMENVSGIALTGQGERHELLDGLVEEYRRMGYAVTFRLLNTVDYRVPQNRRRMILVGILGSRTPFSFPPAICEEGGLGIYDRYSTVADALSDIPTPIEDEPQPYGLPPQTPLQAFLRQGSNALYNHLVTRHSEQMTAKLSAQRVGTRLYPNWNHSWYRLMPNKPSPAVKENHRAPFVHYRENRATSPRECARLQTIPDRVILAGTKTHGLIMVGNAVPPIFSAHLATALANQAFGVDVAIPWDEDKSPLKPGKASEKFNCEPVEA